MTRSQVSNSPKLFYGWWIVLVSAVGLCFGYAPIVVFSFGAFIKPLTQELHSSRASISFAFTLANLMGGFSSPLTGRLVDRFGARKVILVATIIFSFLFFSAELLPARLWTLYVFYSLLGFVGSGAAPVPYGKVVSRWFDRRRGLALGFTMCGVGTGAILMPALSIRLVAAFGWRFAFAMVGTIVLIVCIPVVGFFLKDAPEDIGLLPDGAAIPLAPLNKEVVVEGVSWREARRTPTFWIIVGSISLVGVSVHACVIHLTPLLNDAGSSPDRIALATSVLGVALLLGRLGTGYFLDRFFAPRVAMTVYGATACGIALLRVSATSQFVYVAAFLVGLGIGAEVDILAYLISRYFGMRFFGELYGYSFAAFALAGALGPWFTGLGFDRYGSYSLMLAVFIVLTLLALALLARLGPYRFHHA
ncbi:MAG TPA: MFS transporter [Candidatus Solibacter sp.]|nr:MFS transporter [Candidatus Solibacter sp.]